MSQSNTYNQKEETIGMNGGGENPMGYKPVKSLLISLSLPMMISMLVQALYNIVDSLFVSWFDQSGVAMEAVSLAFPVQSFMIAMSAGMGVGMNALLSRSLGEKNPEKASKAAMNGLFLSLCNSVLFFLIGIFGIRLFYLSQHAQGDLLKYGVEYLSTVCVLSFGLNFQMTLERLLQSTGKSFYSMITQGLGAIINLILDPIMIFGLFGFPKLGVFGAAIATVIGQVAAACLALFFNLKLNKEIKFSLKDFAPDWKIIGKIYVVGLPSIIMQSIGSIMVYLFNQILDGISESGRLIFGVYFKIQSFVFMPVFGLNNGMIPIIAYNFGAKKGKRVKETIRFAVLVAEIIMGVGVLLFMIFPKPILSAFNFNSYGIMPEACMAFRIISVHFLMAGVNIILSSSFQALGNGIYSMCISIMRQLVVLLPAAFLLSLTGNLNLVWFAFPIAEVFAMAVTLICMARMNKKVINRIGG